MDIAQYTTSESDGFSIETSYVAPETPVEETHAPAQEAPAVEAPSTDAPLEESEEQPDQAAGDRDDKGRFKPKGKEGNPRHDIHARLGQSQAELQRERQRAADLERQLNELRAPRQAETQSVTSDRFDGYDEYVTKNPNATWDDWNDAKMAHAIKQARIEWQREADERQAQSAYQSMVDAHQRRLETALMIYPDLPKAIAAVNQAFLAAGIRELPPALERAVLSSEQSDELTYFLGTHPEEAIQLAREAAASGPNAAPILRRHLETLVRSAAATGSASVTPRSTAKPPVNPVGGSANATPARDEDLEFGPEYVDRMNKRDAARRR